MLLSGEQRKTYASSASSEWETPQHLFDKLNFEFGFTLDPCSTHDNAKCEKHYTVETDGLAQDWSHEIVFMNPPYGREISFWVRKALEESIKGATVVCLLPSRTDTGWWHDYVTKASDVRFLRGRLKFGSSTSNAPFPSVVVIFKGK